MHTPCAPVAEALAEALAETLFCDIPTNKRKTNKNKSKQTKVMTNKSKLKQ